MRIENSENTPLLKILEPFEPPKLLVKHANSMNIQKIINLLLVYAPELEDSLSYLEIGSGDCYFSYLASLACDVRIKKFVEKIVETENDKKLIEKIKQQGKIITFADAEHLGKTFEWNSFPLVISMNVLDLFPNNKLDVVIENIKAILKEKGLVVHVMSSSIHQSIFNDIATQYPDKILFPYVENNFVGVLLIDRSFVTEDLFFEIPRDASILAQLFKKNPEEYFRISEHIASNLRIINLEYIKILLHEYSIKKIQKHLLKNGFEIIFYDYITSSILVNSTNHNSYNSMVNNIKNNLGVLFVNQTSGIENNMIKEESVFAVLIGRKLS